ncbi:Pyruvate dehydrogenase complex repressor [Leminorella richardii]|uniref:Pyruvate dehydrogenase complex repressor n=1 Tax=Leminorella richardii TaxID=158841 RepID=A0A2X4UZR0_9GAMM|nr:FadR/GntR family transcriptional regulator [Leminorella richardii]SQI44343.1 Pyruvate dehydrogenase complex repressor [Leminorella richardii]
MQFSIQQQAAHRNLSYVVAEKIAHSILSGQYAAESILPGENELCEIYSVSRTAIREAVKMLTAKGMILARPRIGTRVMPQSYWNFLDKELLSWWITKDNFLEVTDHFVVLRRALEPQAAALAATNASNEQRYQLSLLMAEMRALHREFDADTWVKVDTDFHELIYTASCNPLLTSFSILFSSVYQTYFRSVTNNEVIKLEHHQSIVDAILKKDAEAALTATQALLEKDIKVYNF